jgi:hypothetical protein
VARVLRFPPGISQRDIEQMINIDTQIHTLQVIRNKHVDDVIGRLLAGADVEDGLHCVALRQSPAGAVRVISLCVDGRRIR